jgi:CubicO group peptidase (beta-lactamase class C family)
LYCSKSVIALFQQLKMYKFLVFHSVLILFIFNLTFGQNKAQKLDSLFSELYKSGKFNGNILIAEKGKTIYQNSFGISNVAQQEKLNLNTVFELMSVSKQFTAMAIVLLKEQRKLSYDDPISKYLPNLENYSDITLRQLMTHTSGLPDYENLLDSLFDKSKIATNKDVIQILQRHNIKRLFKPNSMYQYAQTGYALLASIIEEVSKEKYADFMESHIFKPLGMKHTFVHSHRLNPKKIKNYAFGYVQDSLKKYVLPDALPDFRGVIFHDGIIGGRSVHSTLSDLLIWDRALKNNRLISQKVFDEIYSPAILENGKKSDYGFGMKIENSIDYGRILRHTGGSYGYATCFERHLTKDYTIIILQNHDWDYITMPAEDVRGILYGK